MITHKIVKATIKIGEVRRDYQYTLINRSNLTAMVNDLIHLYGDNWDEINVIIVRKEAKA